MNTHKNHEENFIEISQDTVNTLIDTLKVMERQLESITSTIIIGQSKQELKSDFLDEITSNGSNLKEIRKTHGISMRPSYHKELTKMAKQSGMSNGELVERIIAKLCGFEYKKEGKAR